MAKKRTIVGSALTPTLLRELGAIDQFPPTPADFKPDGNWVNAYRIWTCHGYRESGNEDVGSVRIQRTRDSNRTFTLSIHQEVAQTDGVNSIIDGTIQCQNNQLASPVNWRLSSRFAAPGGEKMPELSSVDSGVTVEQAENSTSDWCLFEAVQRLAFDKQSSLSFNLLEGMRLPKLQHRLSYRGIHPMKTDEGNMPLHCFVQLGNGILPYEYWLDARHRLLAVTSMNKAYILDEKAARITER